MGQQLLLVYIHLREIEEGKYTKNGYGEYLKTGRNLNFEEALNFHRRILKKGMKEI